MYVCHELRDLLRSVSCLQSECFGTLSSLACVQCFGLSRACARLFIFEQNNGVPWHSWAMALYLLCTPIIRTLLHVWVLTLRVPKQTTTYIIAIDVQSALLGYRPYSSFPCRFFVPTRIRTNPNISLKNYYADSKTRRGAYLWWSWQPGVDTYTGLPFPPSRYKTD